MPLRNALFNNKHNSNTITTRIISTYSLQYTYRRYTIQVYLASVSLYSVFELIRNAFNSSVFRSLLSTLRYDSSPCPSSSSVLCLWKCSKNISAEREKKSNTKNLQSNKVTESQSNIKKKKETHTPQRKINNATWERREKTYLLPHFDWNEFSWKGFSLSCPWCNWISASDRCAIRCSFQQVTLIIRWNSSWVCSMTLVHRGAESAGKMKNFPVRQKYFQKMSPKGKMFSSRETFFPRKKKKFFKNFPQIHKFSKFSPYGRTHTRVDSAPLLVHFLIWLNVLWVNESVYSMVMMFCDKERTLTVWITLIDLIILSFIGKNLLLSIVLISLGALSNWLIVINDSTSWKVHWPFLKYDDVDVRCVGKDTLQAMYSSLSWSISWQNNVYGKHICKLATDYRQIVKALLKQPCKKKCICVSSDMWTDPSI